MTSLAPLANVFFFLSGYREYLIIVGILALICSGGLLVFSIVVYHWAGPRNSVPERIRYPREPAIDLSRERDEFERQREAREEAELLRRIA